MGDATSTGGALYILLARTAAIVAHRFGHLPICLHSFSSFDLTGNLVGAGVCVDGYSLICGLLSGRIVLRFMLVCFAAKLFSCIDFPLPVSPYYVSFSLLPFLPVYHSFLGSIC